MESLRVLGIRIDKVTMDEAVTYVTNGLKGEKPFVIVTPNSEIVMDANYDKKLGNFIENADLVVPDGIGLVMGSKVIKKPLRERVTGIDLMDRLLKYADENKKSVYLLGAKDGTARMAGENIKKKYPNLILAGTHHGYYKGMHCGHKGHPEEVEVLNEIKGKNVDMLFIGFGAPKQEMFIDEYKNVLGAKILMGVGGSFDVISGNIERAPQIYQKMGMEWFYRGIKEPWRFKRMAKLPKFVINVCIHKEKPLN
ncbi:MAG: WecB/TagA/CpsF family glycosyltransferase [Filifactoraceae bacterium]